MKDVQLMMIFPSVTSIDFLMTLSLPNGVPGPWDMVSHAALQGRALLYQLPEQAGPAPWRPPHGSCDVWRVSAMVPGTQSISQNKRRLLILSIVKGSLGKTCFFPCFRFFPMYPAGGSRSLQITAKGDVLGLLVLRGGGHRSSPGRHWSPTFQDGL